MDEAIYEVFARKKRGDALSHVGYLQAPDEELARIYAWKTYDEENWFEMCVIPRSAIVPVNRAGGGFATRQQEAGASAEAGADTGGRS